MTDFKKWFAARARNPDKITLEEAFDAGASAQQRAQPTQSVPNGWLLVPEKLVDMFCGAVDNLGDMPISEEWADLWSNEASALLRAHNYFCAHDEALKPEAKPCP